MTKEARIKVTYGDGRTESLSLDEAYERGIGPIDPEKSSSYYSYTDDEGTTRFSQDASVLPASITLDEVTGNIKITAPKEVTNLPEFQEIFNEDVLKEYSRAYKLNPDYKVNVTEYDKETGEEKGEKAMTIPEWVADRNESLKLFMQQLNQANQIKKGLVEKWGEGANNLSLSQIVMTQQFGNYTYLPELLKNRWTFGANHKINPFAELFSKVGSDGRVSAEDIKSVYTRDNFGRDEITNLLAVIDGRLRDFGFGDEYYEDDNGNQVKNLNSAEEGAKLIAFRNFILSHTPEGNWFQEAGANIETLGLSALYGADRVFFNFANDVEWVVTAGQGHTMQNYIKDLDSTMDWYVQTKSLESKATSALYTIGVIGGTIGGTLMLGAAGKTAGKYVGQHLPAVINKTLLAAANIKEGTAAYEALSNASLIGILSNAESLSKGARLVVAMATTAEKASLLKNIYSTFVKSHGLVGEMVGLATEFLMDTLHDALVYDSVTLREALENSDQDVKDFWMGELASNAQWWGGMAAVKMGVKYAGKTTLGKAFNVISTKLINKVAYKIGNAKTKFKDYVHGGDIVDKLRGQLEEAIDKGHKNKARRLQNKIEIEQFNYLTRQARKSLSDIKIEWDGLKPTEATLEKFRDATTRIKALEVAFDNYRNSVEYKRQELIGAQYDPATGKFQYINPSLAKANIAASDAYFNLAKLAEKYNLALAEKSLISQEMIDYWVGRYYEKLATSFAENATDAGVRAKNALPTIQKNLENAKSALPEEITGAIDDIVNNKIFQAYYLEQNEYGMAKGLFNRAKVQSYYDNKIWAENGYMPIVVDLENGRKVKLIDPEGLSEAKLTEEFEKLEFKVEEGQHYQDPELVRNKRINDLAQMEINAGLYKAYAGFGSDATNITVISGEQTEYVRVLNESRNYVNSVIEDRIKVIDDKLKESMGESFKKTRRRPPIKNTTVPEADRIEIINSMSPEMVDAYLIDKGILGENKNIVDTVTAENYAEWYGSQSQAVKKYLTRQYQTYNPEEYTAKYTTKDIREGKANAETRVNLAKAVADESNGEKLVLWRTQSTGVDNFYGSAGGTGTWDDATRAKWEGGRWAYIGSEPTTAGGYGSETLAFPVKKTDIMDSYTVNEFKDTANELYTMKYGSKTQKEIYAKSYAQAGQSIENLPHYDELSKLKKSQLKKVADGDPRALLDASGKKIINYTDRAGKGSEWVLFPDRNPELFQEGVADMAEMSKIKAMGSYDDFSNAAKNGGADFEDGLRRSTLVGDKSLAKTTLMNEAKHNLDQGKEAFYQGVLVAEVKGNLRNVKYVDTTKLVDGIIPEFKNIINDYVDVALDDDTVKKAIAVLAEDTEASEEFARYIVVRQLADSDMDTAYKAIDNFVERKFSELNIDSYHDRDLIQTQLHKLFKNSVDTELDDLTQSVRTTNPDLVDAKTIYDKADALDKEIRGITPKKPKAGEIGENTNIAMYMDDQGRQVFAEVDPAFASLYNYRFNMEKGEASALAKMNAMTSRWFRYGTTSVNLKAFGNQLFRDFGNALYIGGAWETIRHYRQNLIDVFGENIVEQIGRFEPTGYEMKQIRQIAEEAGQTLEEAAVSRELMRGAANAPSSTERTLYKKFMQEAYEDSDTKLTKMKNKITNFVQEHTGKDIRNLSPEHLLNDKRENYLRNRVYAHSLNDALENGYDLQQARVFANFAMNNATTNFGRQLYHLQAIADSTPYFRAAINGSKSFWRMWSLDPVGISGRITCGLIIPVMYLVGSSLGSEENREVYKNIPEYQKSDSLIFVVRGRAISLPMPQEISSLVAPYRQFVEYLYDANKNDFWELMMNDALGFFPYELQGFSTIDMDAMIQNPTILDRMNRGFAKMFSQMAPIPVKTAYMLITGTDPYTGKSLRNPQYSWWNFETNSVESFDYNQNAFAKWFAELPFVKNWMSPELAEKVISGIFGTTTSNLLADITALYTSGAGGALETTLRNATESLTAPFTVPQYDLTNAIWKRAVRELTAKKEALLDGTDLKTISKNLAQETDPEKREALNAKRRTIVHEFQQEVKSMVENLEGKYKGTFGAQEFAAVLNLLNFDTETPYQTGPQYMSNLASDVYYEGRDAAIQTMRALGIDGVHDTSIFGYLTKDKKGNVVMRYNSPIAIMEMDATWKNQNNYHLANIKALINANDMWDKKKAMDAKVDAIYKKGNLSSADYDKINELYVDWNKEVMKVLAPYVQVMTPEAAINNTTVMDYLDSLIKVPSEFKKDRKGKYVTNSKLGTGSATDAYVKSYINYIFGVNDTSYSSGRNYSDRQTYDKENKRWTK